MGLKRKRSDEEEAPPPEEAAEDDAGLSDAEDAVASGRVALPPPAKLHINNKAGLQQALGDMKQELPWIERLEVVSAEPLGALDVNDDLKLELALCVPGEPTATRLGGGTRTLRVTMKGTAGGEAPAL